MNRQDVRRMFTEGLAVKDISRLTGWPMPNIYQELGRMADEEFARYL